MQQVQSDIHCSSHSLSVLGGIYHDSKPSDAKPMHLSMLAPPVGDWWGICGDLTVVITLPRGYFMSNPHCWTYSSLHKKSKACLCLKTQKSTFLSAYSVACTAKCPPLGRSLISMDSVSPTLCPYRPNIDSCITVYLTRGSKLDMQAGCKCCSLLQYIMYIV